MNILVAKARHVSGRSKLGGNAYRQTKILGWCSDRGCHASALGADSSLITVVGKDEGSEFAHQMLKKWR